jgi:hypothetical protein
MISHIAETVQKNPELWDIFTCKEEYAGARDEFGRSLPPHNRNILEPVVSKFLMERGYTMQFPHGHSFAVCLTHDIDVLNQSIPSRCNSALQDTLSQRTADVVSTCSRIFSKKSFWWNFRDTIALEERYQATSSFFFMALEEGEQDYNYHIREVEEELAFIADKGCEIGLHGGFDACDSITAVTRQKHSLEQILGGKVVGYRNHYLRFTTPDSWHLLRRAGFLYDTTFGLAQKAGFRNGLCHPFKPYDRIRRQEIDIVEIPLHIMDTCLFGYMNLSDAEAWDIVQTVVDTVAGYGGILTLLWHNNNMIGSKLKFYEKFLRCCTQKNAWLTSGKSIIETCCPQ